ncbi:MAG: hypothetical protein M1827_001853 [Pycnora praestabilis]|nr:MAG: hypothetical protein M1827_001853 [Pycnora praestabilis]
MSLTSGKQKAGDEPIRTTKSPFPVVKDASEAKSDDVRCSSISDEALPAEPAAAAAAVDVENTREPAFLVDHQPYHHSFSPLCHIMDHLGTQRLLTWAPNAKRNVFSQVLRNALAVLTWVGAQPQGGLDIHKITDKYGAFSVVVRRSAHGGDENVVIQSVTIYSPKTVAILQKALEGSPGAAMGLDQVTFLRPFKTFVHRWQTIVDAEQTASEQDLKEHYAIFRKIIGER